MMHPGKSSFYASSISRRKCFLVLFSLSSLSLPLGILAGPVGEGTDIVVEEAPPETAEEGERAMLEVAEGGSAAAVDPVGDATAATGEDWARCSREVVDAG